MVLSWKGNLPTELKEKVDKVDKMTESRLEETDEQVFCNQQRVLDLPRKHRVGEEDLVPSTGYGYDDVGRDKLEAIYADYSKIDDVLVRPQFSSAIHAIAVGLFSMLCPGDTFYCLTGMPYDTIQEVIGLTGNKPGNMKERGIDFKHIDLLDNDKVNHEQIREDSQDPKVKVVTIQCSPGYAVRASFTTEKIEKMLKFIKEVRPDIKVFVDNYYGEFSEIEEPTFYGADIMVGSPFKNVGAGTVKAGAFLAGKKDLIEEAGSRLNVSDAGRGEGATWGYLRDMYQSLFMASYTTGEALEGMIYTAVLCEEMGMKVAPKQNDLRTDIVQTVTPGESDSMVKFCAVIQHYLPINPLVDPTPYHQDGYGDDVVMVSGSFTGGSTVESSPDGPLRAPYRLYIQGDSPYAHDKTAITHAVERTLHKDN